LIIGIMISFGGLGLSRLLVTMGVICGFRIRIVVRNLGGMGVLGRWIGFGKGMVIGYARYREGVRDWSLSLRAAIVSMGTVGGARGNRRAWGVEVGAWDKVLIIWFIIFFTKKMINKKQQITNYKFEFRTRRAGEELPVWVSALNWPSTFLSVRRFCR
jgi:hypothetical protein